MSQRTTILRMLQDAGSDGITGNQFYAACLPRFAARIKELRDRGHEISTERVDGNHFVYKLRDTNTIEKCGGDRVPGAEGHGLGDSTGSLVGLPESSNLHGKGRSSLGAVKPANSLAGYASEVTQQEPEQTGGVINASPVTPLIGGDGSEVGNQESSVAVITDQLFEWPEEPVSTSHYRSEAA
jgi:hypothetical protein